MSTPPVYPFGQGGYGNASGIRGLPISYYLALFTSEYQGAKNQLAWTTAKLQHYDNISRCLAVFQWAFDLDTAQGIQLDTLGVMVGQSRTVGFQPSNGISPILDDATYRLLLKAKVIQNHWDGTIDNLQSAWQALFPGGQIIIEDNQNMTATVIVSGSFSSIVRDLITNGYIVPRPAAVRYTYTLSDLPIIGFDESTTYVAGFDQGHFS